MADISKITLPNGNTYNIKDTWARGEIEALEAIDNGVKLLGVTSTILADGDTTASLSINNETVTAVKGDLVFAKTAAGDASNKEFLFDGTTWHLLDALNTYGTLASKNTVSVKYDKASVNTKTFTGTAVRLVTGNIAVPDTYSASFTGTPATISVSGTPAGTVSQPTFTGTTKTGLTVSPASSGDATYTPAGSVSKPNISLKTAGSTDTIQPASSVTVAKTVVAAAPGATAPSNSLTYYSVSNETLSLYQLGYTTGASISLGTAKTFKTGDGAYELASTPTFTGTGKRLVVEDYTPTGTVTQPTFTGNALTSTGSYTPTGSVSVSTATTANKTTTVSKASSGETTFTPEGTINVTLTQTNTNASVSYN